MYKLNKMCVNVDSGLLENGPKSVNTDMNEEVLLIWIARVLALFCVGALSTSTSLSLSLAVVPSLARAILLLHLLLMVTCGTFKQSDSLCCRQTR